MRIGSLLLVCFASLALPLVAVMAEPPSAIDPAKMPWYLRPVVRPVVPAGVTNSANPIDAFLAEDYKANGLTPVGFADKRTLLRRVYFDLVGLPPTPAEQQEFLDDPAPEAYEKVVDRLLASEQHGVRYARHWLDVLRYADADEGMIAAPGMYLWRDWITSALNQDLPYDQFVRAQLTGYRSEHGRTSPSGERIPVEPRADDMFALGFLARGAVAHGRDNQELGIAAVETISSAFMGVTVGCAKCHDHKYDPISMRDFYAMKALFDPLVTRKLVLANPAEIRAHGEALDIHEQKRLALQGPLDELIAPYKKKLYEERVALLPEDVRAVIRKPEKDRSQQERKIADDYFPVLRIDPSKILAAMPEMERKRYQELLQKLKQLEGQVADLPAFWSVEVDKTKAEQKSYLLTSGELDRPEKDHPVEPGWPFAPAQIDFRDGRVAAFADWLTAPGNPLLARVAVNRLWQWHMGEGLQKSPSDFGKLGGEPVNRMLLDWLAAEFVQRNFSMKQMHRLIVTSAAYRLASYGEPALVKANSALDPEDTHLWRFRLRRLEAEPIWDAIFTAAGTLDSTVGGPSFEPRTTTEKPGRVQRRAETDGRVRRAAYMMRGFAPNREILPQFLQAFDADDGRVPCPLRTRTVTAPQALFLMNSPEIDRASARFADRLVKESRGDLDRVVDLAYGITLSRAPSREEKRRALTYLDNDIARVKGLAWLLFNLDEFIYVR